MADDLVEVAETRERVRELLAQRFAEGVIDVDRYETRIGAAEDADDLAALQALIADLRPGPAPAPARQAIAVREPTTIAAAGPGPTRVLSVLGSTTRAGAWELPRALSVRCVLGNATLDLREARIAPGTSEIEVRAILGSVEIIVPPGLRVIAEGTSILGDFSGHDHGDERDEGEDAAPLVRIRGIAVLGTVEVAQRQVGESAGDAHGRRRAERKALRRARKALPGA